MPRVINPKMIEPCRVRVTMKGSDYGAEACGFSFEDGVAEKVIDMKDHGRDRNALQSVMTLFPGTSYVVLEKLDPENPHGGTQDAPKKEDESTEKDGEEPETPTYSMSDINAMKKAELHELCGQLDVEYDSSDTVPELKDILIKSLGLDGDGE